MRRHGDRNHGLIQRRAVRAGGAALVLAAAALVTGCPVVGDRISAAEFAVRMVDPDGGPLADLKLTAAVIWYPFDPDDAASRWLEHNWSAEPGADAPPMELRGAIQPADVTTDAEGRFRIRGSLCHASLIILPFWGEGPVKPAWLGVKFPGDPPQIYLIGIKDHPGRLYRVDPATHKATADPPDLRLRTISTGRATIPIETTLQTDPPRQTTFDEEGWRALVTLEWHSPH